MAIKGLAQPGKKKKKKVKKKFEDVVASIRQGKKKK